MKDTILRLYKKHKDIIPYVIFGVLTTLVNIVSYWLLADILGMAVMPSTIIAWLLAVLFAYITNRKWVFYSDAHSTGEIIREALKFFALRLATGVFDWLIMYLFVDVWHCNGVLMKCIANVIVIILNYIASKLVVFRHK